jgi:hypothetical protein
VPGNEVKQSLILKTHVNREHLENITLPLVVGEDYLYSLLNEMKEEERARIHE